jgi:hypothetical protein
MAELIAVTWHFVAASLPLPLSAKPLPHLVNSLKDSPRQTMATLTTVELGQDAAAIGFLIDITHIPHPQLSHGTIRKTSPLAKPVSGAS